MSVGAVGGSGQTNIAQLQRRLQQDQAAMTADQRGDAPQEVQQQARTKVAHDQNMVSDATKAQAQTQAAMQSAAQAAAQVAAAGKRPAPTTRPETSSAPGRHANGSLYL